MAGRFLEACATWLPGRGRNIPLILAEDWLHLLQEGSDGSIGCPGVCVSEVGWGCVPDGAVLVIHGDLPGPARAAGISSNLSSLQECPLRSCVPIPALPCRGLVPGGITRPSRVTSCLVPAGAYSNLSTGFYAKLVFMFKVLLEKVLVASLDSCVVSGP